MLAKITLYDGTIYRIADKTTDTEDGIYLGRIKDELSLVSAMQEAGNAPATINLTIINDDDFIPHSKDLWAAEVLLTNDNGVSWRGKINFCNFDADGNLYVTASEKTAPELELQLPDEVRQVYTVDEDFHQSSVTMTIPIVIGGTTSNPVLLSTILIDKTEGVYLICVGEIRSVVKVYNGVEELPNTAYTAYTGTSSQAEHAGFAYVKINEDYRLNADGSYAEINVEVVGLKLGNFTEEECRNGALFLYYFLTTAATGINGWGCGIDSSLIDSDSFQSAITLCNQLGYKLDGIMWLRQSAQSWIDQICQAIHGKYSINANGKRSLFIDYAGNASKKTFTSSNMRVEKYGKNSYTSVVYNKGILSYDYNPITGLFMQSAQYENAESIAQIGEQKFVGESYMLKDPTTALAVLEYTCKRSQTAAEAIEFETDDIETNLRAGDVITINRPDISINNALYQIQNISITDFKASIAAVKFDTSVFIVGGTPSIVNWGNEKDITPALTPAQATNLLLSTGFDINPDGTGTPYISGTFTVPDGGWLAAAVQYGIGADPTNWTELALITDGRFKISPVNVGTVYSVRVRMITATGHSDYLRGQITATGDTTPPAEPTIAVNATDKTVTVQCGLDNPPYDMGGFQIYRKKSTEADSAYTLIAMVAANRGYASYSDYVSEYITYNYKTKSYDRSGNLSTNFSNVASVTVTGIQANDVAATALSMPTGSILRLSAKNCTTTSIAEANGVKDVSGRGNHGRAYNGVAVAYDDEEDTYFGFNGSANQYILVNPANLLAFVNGQTEFTIIARGKRTGDKSYLCGFANTAGYSLGNFDLYANNVSFDDRIDSNATIKTLTANVANGTSDWHLYAVSVNYNTGIAIIYVDGVEIARSENWFTGTKANVDKFVVGNNPYNYSVNAFVGRITDVRVYPRALSAKEIKTIFMLPDEAVFAQLTADLIGANVIKAQNLIMTENVISNAAQINNAVFQSLIVTNGSTVANQVDVGGRNLLKNSNNGGSGWSNDSYPTCSIYLGSNKPKVGDTVTVSFKATVDWTKISYIGFYNSGGNVPMSSILQGDFDSDNIGRKTFNWIITSPGGIIAANTYVRFYTILKSGVSTRPTITIEWVKLEYGNKATTWTPAPEDTDASINAITTNIYSPNTTTINGGKITTGTIQAAAIAANAITAEKLNVSTRKPSGCIAEYCTNYLPINSTSKSYSVADLSGNALAGSYTGAIYDLRNTLLGHAMRSSTEFSTGVFPDSTNFTLSLWLKNNDTSNHGAFYGHFYNGSTQKGYLWAGGSTQYINLSLETGGGEKGVFANAQDGNVHHYVLTRSGTTIKSYKDGVLSDTITATANGAINKITIGNSYINTNNIAVWNRALSADEVMALFKAGTNAESGQITADRIATDAIKSRNYAYTSGLFSTAGTFLDLSNGALTSKNLAINSSGNIYMKAHLEAYGVSSDEECILVPNNYSKYGIKVQSQYNNSSSIAVYASNSYGIGILGSGSGTDNVGVKGYSYGNYGGWFETTSPSQYALRAEGYGANYYGLYVKGQVNVNGTIVHGSDENIKSEIKDVSVLEKLKKIRVKSWKYDDEKIAQKEYAEQLEKYNKGEITEKPELKARNTKSLNDVPLHIGAMAAEFNEAFGTSNNSKDYISYTDEIGVCMRAIQELAEISDAQKAEIVELKAKLKIQQDEKSDVEQEASYTEKSDNSKDADNLDFPDVGKIGENQQEEQK